MTPGTAGGRVRIGTLAGRLGTARASVVATLIERLRPDTVADVVEVSRSASDVRDALLDGSFDVAAHALEDVVLAEPAGSILAAVPERADPADALVSTDGRTLARLAGGSRVGVSSELRRATVRAVRPDLEPLRLDGGADGWLRDVDSGELDAVVVGAAALAHLGRTGSMAERFDPRRFPPAPGQGALGIEALIDRVTGDLAWLCELEHGPSRAAVDTERTFMAIMEGGHAFPLGAWARWEAGRLVCTAFVADPASGDRFGGEAMGSDPEWVATELAEGILQAGAEALIERLLGP